MCGTLNTNKPDRKASSLTLLCFLTGVLAVGLITQTITSSLEIKRLEEQVDQFEANAEAITAWCSKMCRKNEAEENGGQEL